MKFKYETPEFLKNSEVADIHSRMLSVLPSSLDKSEGQYPYDITIPTAIELSRLKQFEMNEAIKLIWPMFATGEYLDLHGKVRNMPRKSAIKAVGKLLVSGKKSTVIKAGDLFSTAIINEEPAIFFAALEEAVIPDSESIEIEMECTKAGACGNAAAGTVTIIQTKNQGITSVVNREACSGGSEEEEDTDYQERLVEFDQQQSLSYVGNPADYRRWANEVDGVGAPTVIGPKDSTGTVTLVLTDRTGRPASELLCKQVYDHIMSPDDDNLRKAPINAILKVVPSSTIAINLSATVELASSSLEHAVDELLGAIRPYLQAASEDKEIRYTKIGKVLSSLNSVYDYKDLKINGGAVNILLEDNQLPVIERENIVLTEGTI